MALLRALSASSDIGTQTKYRVPYATALYSAGRYEEAIQAADAVLAAAPNDTRALMVKARALVARNLVGEAHALYERILDLEPTHSRRQGEPAHPHRPGRGRDRRHRAGVRRRRSASRHGPACLAPRCAGRPAA